MSFSYNVLWRIICAARTSYLIERLSGCKNNCLRNVIVTTVKLCVSCFVSLHITMWTWIIYLWLKIVMTWIVCGFFSFLVFCNEMWMSSSARSHFFHLIMICMISMRRKKDDRHYYAGRICRRINIEYFLKKQKSERIQVILLLVLFVERCTSQEKEDHFRSHLIIFTKDFLIRIVRLVIDSFPEITFDELFSVFQLIIFVWIIEE